MKITDGCKLTIPRKACVDTEIKEGDYVRVDWGEGKIEIVPVEITSRVTGIK
jgi:hypothetical protein